MGSVAEDISVGLESTPATEAQKEQQVDAIKHPRWEVKLEMNLILVICPLRETVCHISLHNFRFLS